MSDQKEQHVDGVIKQALLEAMDEFHRVCEENDLKYYLIGGSLIGAIRHKGCIPWDDDLDVVMLKDDFQKLLKISDQFKNNFNLRHRNINPQEPEPIARLENITVIVDEGYHSKVENGVFIDVFCLNDTFDQVLFQKLHFRLSAFSRILIRLKTKSYREEKYNKKIFGIFTLLSFFLYPIPKQLLNVFLNVSEKLGVFSFSKRKVANLHGCWKLKEIAPKALFEKRKLYDFEGRQYWSIEDADAWLRPIYGDYMKLPSIEDRRPKHISKIISINGKRVY